MKNQSSTYFFTQTPIKYPKYCEKPIHGHKNLKNNSKNQNQLEAKIISMVKSTIFLDEMELIDIKIHYSCYQNC
jgi:hypothetical protein